MQCYKNAKPTEQIHVLDRAFHYGDGCFSTARFRQNQIELFDRHLARLQYANRQLSLNANLELITETLTLLKQAHGELNGTLKIVLSRGVGQRGYSLPDHPADVWVFFYPQVQASLDTAYHYDIIHSGVLTQAIGLSMPNLVGLKSLNRLEQVLLKQEADQKGWPEALVTDVQGSVVEGVSSNCFIRINNTWITPQLGYNGVHGVMRAEILSRMQQQNLHCEQRDVHVSEIAQIQSLFFCNALTPMKIVSHLGQQVLDVQPCVELFKQLQLNQIHSYV